MTSPARSIVRGMLGWACSWLLLACPDGGGQGHSGDGGTDDTGNTSDTGDTTTADEGSSDGGTDTDPPCPPGEERCEGECTDPMASDAHCGACGSACEPGQACEAGECVVPCAAPMLECEGECIDPREDFDHCGACGNACGGLEDCIDGGCVFGGCEFGEPCGEVCVDTQADLLHCGMCGHACDPGDACVAPQCIHTEQLVANGDFSAGLTSWTSVNNPVDSQDVFSFFFVSPSGVLSNGVSMGPCAKAIYQDFVVPTGMISAAELTLCVYQSVGGQDPANVTVIETDPFDADGGGPQDAFRVDLVDPMADVFYAPILYELYAPTMSVGAPGMCATVMVDDPSLAMVLQANEGQPLRLRLAQVESTMGWSLTVDDIGLTVETAY